jgi:threonylcarbamoyladenosine tRNA methylthiotransferase CDKAL1
MRFRSQTFHIYGNSGGCPQNQLDSAHLFRYLVANGWRYVKSPANADLVVVNGCGYRKEKEEQSLAKAREATRLVRPGGKVILAGCMPKIAPAIAVAAGPGVDVMRGIDRAAIQAMVPPERAAWDDCVPGSIPAELLTYVKPFRNILTITLNRIRNTLPFVVSRHFDRLFMYDHSPDTHIVRVAEGCLGHCAYCAIRFSRGPLKSAPLDTVLTHVQESLKENPREIFLSATDLAAYGRDIGLDLSDLLRHVLDIARDQYLLLFYANPRWMIDIWPKLEPLFATGRIHFIHLSLNGGSDGVLRRMARGYALGEYEALVRAIKRASPGTIIQTQVITGFPGETDAEFAETLAFFRRNYIHNVQVFAFDARPGTAAATMEGQIPMAVRQQRRWRLYRQTLWAKVWFNIRYVANGLKP